MKKEKKIGNTYFSVGSETIIVMQHINISYISATHNANGPD